MRFSGKRVAGVFALGERREALPTIGREGEPQQAVPEAKNRDCCGSRLSDAWRSAAQSVTCVPTAPRNHLCVISRSAAFIRRSSSRLRDAAMVSRGRKKLRLPPGKAEIELNWIGR